MFKKIENRYFNKPLTKNLISLKRLFFSKKQDKKVKKTSF